MQSDASARNGHRAGQERVPEAVLRRMADRLEAPDPSHNDWERNTEVLPSEKLPPLEAAHVRRLLPSSASAVSCRICWPAIRIKSQFCWILLLVRHHAQYWSAADKDLADCINVLSGMGRHLAGSAGQVGPPSARCTGTPAAGPPHRGLCFVSAHTGLAAAPHAR